MHATPLSRHQKLRQFVAKRKAKVSGLGGQLIFCSQYGSSTEKPLPIKGTWLFSAPVNASIVATLLCCRPLLAATVMVYSVPGSSSARVVVVISFGTVSWNRNCTLHFNANKSIRMIIGWRLYLTGDSRRGCVGDLIMVDGTLDHTPHKRDGFVCRSCHSEIHGHVQPYKSSRTVWCVSVVSALNCQNFLTKTHSTWECHWGEF